MKSPLSLLAWLLIGLAVVVSFVIDWRNVAQGGAIDLRNRITGIRLLEHGLDPYHFKWQPGDPPEYCDPTDNPNRPVSRTTVTPALLLLHVPFAALPYRTVEFSWLITQWLVLLGTGWLWFRAATTPLMSWLAVLAVVVFSFTAAWRLHAERGQSYVLLTFLFACWLTATLDTRRSRGFLAGFLAGMLVTLRPPFLLLVPFLGRHGRGQMVGAITGLILGLGLPMLLLPGCWADYFSSTQTISDLYRHGIHASSSPLIYPLVIEGMPLDLISHSLYLPGGTFSVHAFLERLKLEPFPAGVPIAALVVLFAIWIWFTRKQPVAQLLPGMAAWLFLADLCLPVLRADYDDVLILNVIAASLAVSSRIPWAAWPCLVALPIGALVYFRNLDHPWVLMPSALFTLGAIMALFPPPPQPQINEVARNPARF